MATTDYFKRGNIAINLTILGTNSPWRHEWIDIGGQPRVDLAAKIIYSPPFGPLSDDENMLVYAYAIHENAHALLSPENPLPTWTKLEKFLVNSLEDIRIEYAISIKYPTIAYVLQQANNFSYERIFKKEDGKKLNPIMETIFCLMARENSFYVREISPEAQHYIDLVGEEYASWKKLPYLTEVKGYFEIVRLALKIAAMIKEENQKQQEPDDENVDDGKSGDGENKDDKKDSKSGKDGKSGKNDKQDKDDKKDKSDKNNKSDKGEKSDKDKNADDNGSDGDDNKDQDGDKNGSGKDDKNDSEKSDDKDGQGKNKNDEKNDDPDDSTSGKDDKKDSRADNDNSGNGDGEGDGETESGSESGKNGNDQQIEEYDETIDGKIDKKKIKKIKMMRDYLGEFDKSDEKTPEQILIETISKISKTSCENIDYLADTTEDKIIIPAMNHDEYYKSYNSIKSSTSSLYRYLEQAMVAITRNHRVNHLDNGKIDRRNLPSLTKSLTKNVFYKTYNGQQIDTCVTICLDESGSMCMAYEPTRALIIAFTECLNKLKIPFQIVGASTLSHWGRQLHAPFTRTNPIRWHKYKTFDEQFEVVKTRLGSTSHYINYVDGEMIENCAMSMYGRKEKRKIILSFSDGMPDAGHGTSNCYRMGENLKDVIKKHRENGICIYGFGIGTETPKEYYGENGFVYLEDINKMDGTFFNSIVKIIGIK